MVKITNKQQFNKFWCQLGSNMTSLSGLHQLFLVIAANTEVSSYLTDRSLTKIHKYFGSKIAFHVATYSAHCLKISDANC